MNTNDAKITLSDKELELVCNADWILTKLGIIEKVYQLFGTAVPAMQQLLQKAALPENLSQTSPKISKGESYRQLPWVMLDYPRYFGKEDQFAIRSFFWWGNHFSVTLHVAGLYKQPVAERLYKHYPMLAVNGYYICVNAASAWEHYFEADNYIPVSTLTEAAFRTCLVKGDFVKIARKLSLPEWASAGSFIHTSFGEIMEMLKED